MNQASDEDLVRRYLQDPAGTAGREPLEALFARYDERVYVWCFRFVRDHERALDLAQDVLLLAYRGLSGFRGEAKFSSWLFAIARHRCLRAVRRPSLVRDEAVDLDALDDRSQTPERTVDDADELDRLREIMDAALTPQERQALWLRCEEGLPVEEITAMLGLTSSSGARGLLQTARRKLRAALEGQRPGAAEGTTS